MYKKYKNPLNDVKQDRKPLIMIVFFELFNFFGITYPKINDPMIETKKLLLIFNLNKVAV